jgi:hypothetical protein
MKSFLSYPSEQLPAARAVYAFLKSIGVVVWFDRESLIGGQDWDRERKLAQQAADLIFLLCSEETFGRAGVIQREVKDILERMRDKPLGHLYVIPLRIRPVTLPPELSPVQYIDYFRAGWTLSLARSVRLRIQQLKEDEPSELGEFLVKEERVGGVVFKTLHRISGGFRAQADYFGYQAGGDYWDFVNSSITVDVVGSYYKALPWAADWVENRQVLSHARDVDAVWERRVIEYFRDDEFVSLHVDGYESFGGAHPTRGEYAKNFGGRICGELDIRTIFGHSHETLKDIRTYCMESLRERFSEAFGGHDIFDSSGDPWEKFSQWNFNREGLRFYFNMYSGFPFVIGYQEVDVPWSVVKDKIAGAILSTPFGAFIQSCR